MRRGLICLGVLTAVIGGAYYVSGIPVELPRFLSNVAASPSPQAQTPRPGIPVVVAVVRADDVPIYLTGIGTVQAYNTVAVKTRVDGQITQILFQEGQDVKVGDPLAIIDPRPLEAQLSQQEATLQKDQALLESAVLDLRRFENLVLRDFASRQSVDQQRALVAQYRAQLTSDQAQIQYARTQLSYTKITSPINGRVGIRQIDVGNFVHAGDNATIVVITQLQPVSAVFTLAATAVGQTRLTIGSANYPVIALAADDTTELDQGTIDMVDNQVDQATGTIKLKASFANKALKLWPGNFVNGRVVVDTRKNGLTLPSAAVRHGPRGDFAWVVRSDQTVEARGIGTGQVFDGRTLIERGLSRDERVVIDGYFRLETGSRVEVVKTDSGTPPAAIKLAPRPS